MLFFDSIKDIPWTILHLGQCSLGICIKAKGNAYYTQKPFGAHSYIINGKELSTLLQTIPKSEWRRPYFTEGFSKIPMKKKLAVFPNITFQYMIPREMESWQDKVVVVRRFDFNTASEIFNILSVYGFWILIAILILIVLIVVYLLIVRKKNKE